MNIPNNISLQHISLIFSKLIAFHIEIENMLNNNV